MIEKPKPRDCPQTWAVVYRMLLRQFRPSLSEEEKQRIAEAVTADTLDDSIAEAQRLLVELTRQWPDARLLIHSNGNARFFATSGSVHVSEMTRGEIIPALRRLVAEAQPTAADLFDRAAMAANAIRAWHAPLEIVDSLLAYFEAAKREREAKR